MNIIKLNAIHSTNSYLKELSRMETSQDGLVVTTKNQIYGRGQHGNSWYFEVEKSLAFSVFKRFEKLSITKQPALLFATSLAVKNALEAYNIPNLKVKWPNDIMSYSKKVGGILVENQVLKNRIQSAVIGVGLNVNNQTLPGLPNATSLYLATQTVFNLEDIMREIVSEIYAELKGINNFETLKSRYESALFKKDEVSVFDDTSGKRFNGKIMGVANDGSLQVLTEDDGIEKFKLKEIKMLL